MRSGDVLVGLAEAEQFRGGEQSYYGKKALAEAVRLKDHGSATDKMYIEAAAAAADEKNGGKQQQIALLRKLVKKEPKDLEARIFLAGAVGDGSTMRASPSQARRNASRFWRACCATRR